jgi:hypothetical protein
MLVVLVECLEEWAAWVVWVEWACNTFFVPTNLKRRVFTRLFFCSSKKFVMNKVMNK